VFAEMGGRWLMGEEWADRCGWEGVCVWLGGGGLGWVDRSNETREKCSFMQGKKQKVQSGKLLQQQNTMEVNRKAMKRM